MRIFFCFFSAILFLSSCSMVSTIESSSSIGKFHVDVSKSASADMVTITGDLIDSALWIKSYEIIYADNCAFVKITRSVSSTGCNGPYHIQFVISKSVDRIILGEKEVIWKR